jgi:hypothetical protein
MMGQKTLTKNKSIRRLFSGVLRLVKSTSLVVGLAVMMALMVGVASSALAGTGIGGVFNLGKTNTVNAVTKLAGIVPGASLVVDNNSTGSAATALNLQVEAGKAPMKVNSPTKVENLNADQVDGKHADQIGVNGLEQVRASSAEDSNSAKSVTAYCPSGKIVVGSGFDIVQVGIGSHPNAQTDVVVDSVYPFSNAVSVSALEEESTSANWYVMAVAICATAP